jgi:hypothetical protein
LAFDFWSEILFSARKNPSDHRLGRKSIDKKSYGHCFWSFPKKKTSLQENVGKALMMPPPCPLCVPGAPPLFFSPPPPPPPKKFLGTPLHERASGLRYTYISCTVCFKRYRHNS